MHTMRKSGIQYEQHAANKTFNSVAMIHAQWILFNTNALPLEGSESKQKTLQLTYVLHTHRPTASY